jgi:hypothetical protein
MLLYIGSSLWPNTGHFGGDGGGRGDATSLWSNYIEDPRRKSADAYICFGPLSSRLGCSRGASLTSTSPSFNGSFIETLPSGLGKVTVAF